MKPRRYQASELEEFEQRAGIALPPAYARYLLSVGAGEAYGSRVGFLEDWCQPFREDELPHDFLAQPFPHCERWNDKSLIRRSEGWFSPYYDRLLFRGSMRIQNLGDEAYSLMVVSGPERGRIWRDERARQQGGIYPVFESPRVRLTVESLLSAARAGTPVQRVLARVFGRSS